MNVIASLQVESAPNWPKLAAELKAAIGGHPGLGFAFDDIPGALRVLGDAPLTDDQLARAAQAIAAHDPTPTAAEADEQRWRALEQRHGLSRTALKALAGDQDAVAALRAEVEGQSASDR